MSPNLFFLSLQKEKKKKNGYNAYAAMHNLDKAVDAAYRPSCSMLILASGEL